LDLAHQLSIKFEWLNDDSNFLTKTRELDSIKQIGGEKQRAEYLKGAYSTKESSEPAEIYGFLVIDDVFETGSTLREICRTLEGSFPGIPRYVLTVTQKKPTVIWKMGQ
jgi:predicted amidophosphoribosyltransferase